MRISCRIFFRVVAAFLFAQSAFCADATRQENVVIHNSAANIDLAATFTAPQGKGPFPAVLLINDVGRQVRAGFADLPEVLAEHGIASLSYDKRGVGNSSGDYDHANLPDFSGDAARAADYLRDRPDVLSNHTGILGTGEGAMFAAYVAAKNPAISFCVLIGLPATGYAGVFEDVLLKRSDDVNRAQHLPEADVAKGRAVLKGILDAEINSRTMAEEKTAIKVVFDQQVADKKMPQAMEDQTLAGWDQRKIPFPVSFAPQVSLHHLLLPVLVVYGEKDQLSPPAENLPVVKYALANTLPITFLVLPGDNHILQKAKTGGMEEWKSLGKPYNDGDGVDAIVGWISRTVK